MAVIGSLTVKLGLVTMEWDKATEKAKKQAKDLQAAMSNLGVDLSKLQMLFRNLGGAAGLSVAGVTAMSHAIMEMAGQVNDLADAYDLSVGRVLQFQKAIMLAGGKAEDANTILGTLFTRISSAQEGNDAVIAQFEALGISFEELKQSTPDQLLRRVYEGLNGIGNTFERVKAVRELLGKAGLGKNLQEVTDTLSKSTAEFDRHAASLKKWDDMGDALALTFKNLQLAFADLFAPFTTKGIISVEQFKAAMIALGSALVVNGIFRLVAAFKALNVALKEGVALSVAISGASGIKGAVTAAAAIAAYIATLKGLESPDGEGASVEGQITGPPLGGKPEGIGGVGGGRAAATAKAQLDYQKQLLAIAKQRNEYQLNYLNGSQDELQIVESYLKFQEELAKAQFDRAQESQKEGLSKAQIALIEEKYALAVKKATQEEEARNALINARRDAALAGFTQETQFIAERNKLIESGLKIELDSRNMSEYELERNKELLNIQGRILLVEQERERIRQSGLSPTSPEYVNEMERLRQAEEAITRQGQLSLERIRLNQQEIKNFTDGWEKAWREFARSAENYGKVAESAFSSITDNMSRAISNFVQTGKLSFKDFARSIIQDLIRIQMTAQANTLFKAARSLFSFASPEALALKAGIAPLAEGGPASANTPYLVGERGPELFMPSTAGTVVPNNKLGGMGTTTNVTNYNIQAIDVKSFEERILGSAKAVWAANTYASKGIAMAGGRA